VASESVASERWQAREQQASERGQAREQQASERGQAREWQAREGKQERASERAKREGASERGQARKGKREMAREKGQAGEQLQSIQVNITIPHVTDSLSSVINVAFFKIQLCLPERGVVAPVACGGL
jgi:hypothetical protein